MVDRGELGGVIGVLAGMVGAAVSWAAGLGVLTILLSVGLGSYMTYMVGARTQKNAWKREADLRKVEDIYGPLYYQLNKLSKAIADDVRFFYYPGVESGQADWESIRASYKYYLVDTALRDYLERFFALLAEYSENNSKKPRILEEKLLPRLREAFGEDVQAATYQVSAKQTNGMPAVFEGGTLDAPIMAGEHPLEFTIKQYTGYVDPQLELALQRKGAQKFIFTAQNPDPISSLKFDDLVKATIEDLKRDPRMLQIGEQRKALMAQAESLKEKLRVKTEGPWNV